MRINAIVNIGIFIFGIFIGRQFLIMLVNFHQHSESRNMVEERAESLRIEAKKYVTIRSSDCYELGSRVSR